ncbi:hypothetical protein PAPYR_7887 [Paratrimastix pyriformis]|uniref:Uncharacterized protein n=1 Tax=Paratrimastix pyriformis TaxID=342808 RepID=A0ABQ8UBV0_9EUKA|nr:hypothetical protein PAPYR_7887 [Paratrimastix pyriformis]
MEPEPPPAAVTTSILEEYRNLVRDFLGPKSLYLMYREVDLQLLSDISPSLPILVKTLTRNGCATVPAPAAATVPAPAAATVPAPALATACLVFQHVLRRAFGGPASVVTAGMTIGQLRAQHDGNVIYFQDTGSFDIVIPRDTDPVAPNTRYTEIEPYDLYTFEVRPNAVTSYVQSHPGFSLRRELAQIAQNAGFRGSVAHPEFPDVYVIEVAIPVGSDRLKAFQLAFHRMIGFDLPAPSSILRITATPPPPEFTHDQRRTFSLLHCVADTTP